MTTPSTSVVRCLRAAVGDADGPTDAALLQRFALSRDPEAFELLIWRHAGMVMRVCRSRLRDHHAAEDASQAVFLALAKQAGAVCRRGTVAGWLYRVAWRIAAKSTPRHGLHLIEDWSGTPALDAPREYDPELMQALHEELARLPEKLRTPILLCFFEGLTHKDAAKRLGWPLGTLAARIARGKDRLQRRLSNRGMAMPAAGLSVLIVSDPVSAFVRSTVTCAVAFVSGTGANTIPSSILQLAQGAIRTMTVLKIRQAAGALTVCGMLVFGAAWASGPGTSAGVNQPPAGATEAPPPVAEEVRPADKPVARIASSAQRKRSLENLKQLVLACHEFDTAKGHLPADIRDKDGKALLSWRVAILPYLEQDALYRQFRLNESWDSEHNLKLLAKMPDVMRVGYEPKDATHTHYQVFAGVGTPFGPTRVVFGPAGGVGGGAASPGGSTPGPMGGVGSSPPQVEEKLRYLPVKLVPDGTSNTFGVVEAGPAVAWTKPADIVYDAKNPLPQIDWPFANAHHVSMLDGMAFAIRPDLDPKVLRIFIGMDDGLVSPSPKTLQARLPVETDADRAELKKLTDRNAKLIAESEKLLMDQVELLKKRNATAIDFTQVEEQADRLRQMIVELKEQNRKLRADCDSMPLAK